MKKLLVSLLATIMLVSLVGCGKKESTDSTTTAPSTENTTTAGSDTEDTTTTGSEASDETLGNMLANLFLAEIKAGNTDLNSIAEKLDKASDYGCDILEIEEGYLAGFSEEIKGFKKGIKFAPMIGSIPFVNYIFEVEDAESFKETLLSVADPRWNICTEAAETVCVTSGNYVFFTMCPGEDEME